MKFSHLDLSTVRPKDVLDCLSVHRRDNSSRFLLVRNTRLSLWNSKGAMQVKKLTVNTHVVMIHLVCNNAATMLQQCMVVRVKRIHQVIVNFRDYFVLALSSISSTTVCRRTVDYMEDSSWEENLFNMQKMKSMDKQNFAYTFDLYDWYTFELSAYDGTCSAKRILRITIQLSWTCLTKRIFSIKVRVDGPCSLKRILKFTKINTSGIINVQITLKSGLGWHKSNRRPLKASFLYTYDDYG